jgi:hypothetical protein
MADKGWHRAFHDPIPLPGGGELHTLRDAATYITKLPKREHDAPEWRVAIEALMLVDESSGPTMMARIGVMRALHRHDKADCADAAQEARESVQDRSIVWRSPLYCTLRTRLGHRAKSEKCQEVPL